MKEWSLIVNPVPEPGSWNMAVDDYLFHSLGEDPRTVVRFYRWSRPTVSLGYSQAVDKVADLEYCRRHGIDVVRRMTGGKLVLHDREITYSVCSSDTTAFSATLAESYRLISNGLIRGLEKMGLRARLAGEAPVSYRRGLMPCFSYPARDEIEIDGRKIIGSAQKRVGARFLQHGSIPLEASVERLRKVAATGAAAEQLLLTSLTEALGRPVSFEWAVDHFVQGLAEYFSISFRPLVFSDEERQAILRTQREKYGNPVWTQAR
jgi:lipoate-protein ligase A